MRKNHRDEELMLTIRLIEAEWNLVEFYMRVRKRSRKYALKKVFGWADEQCDYFLNNEKICNRTPKG